MIAANLCQVKVLVLGQDPYHEPGQVCLLKKFYLFLDIFLTKRRLSPIGDTSLPAIMNLYRCAGARALVLCAACVQPIARLAAQHVQGARAGRARLQGADARLSRGLGVARRAAPQRDAHCAVRFALCSEHHSCSLLGSRNVRVLLTGH